MSKLLPVLALWAGVVSCHLDKLLNSGNPPPSQAPPARVAFASSLSSARAGEPISPPVQVTVQDSTGRVTLRDTLVTLSLGANPGSDKLRGDTVAHSVNGVATFANLRLDKAASGYTLTAAAPQLAADTSAAFNVMPAPATQLLFTVQPSAAMQDSAIKPPVQVTAYDSLGNKATNFTGSVQLRIGTDGSVSKNAGVAGATAPAVAGVATFPDVRIDHAGVGYTLTAAFGTAAPVDTSVAFDITPGPPPPPPPPTHLGFTQQPQTTQVGVAITPPVQVAALDAAEHVVQGFTGAIGLALGANPGGGTLSGGAPVNAVNGVATFPGLSIDQPGNGYTLRATASGLTAGTSGTFDVTAAPPTTGDLTVTTSTTGASPDPDGYTFAVDGGTPQPIGVSQTITVSTLPAGSHTVVLSGIASNCTVSNGTSRPVTVPAGASVTASFSVTCPTPVPTTGDLTVTTSTSGASPDPDGYTVTVDGTASQPISNSGSVTFNALSAGSHTVALSGVAANCAVTGGTSQNVTVPAAGTATAAFTITCAALTGSLTVTTTTTGQNAPTSYTVTVDGGQSRTIAANGGTTTYTGLSATDHTVALTDVPANCTASGGASKTVTVTAGGTASAPFTISCTALTGSVTATTTTSGPDQPSGYTVAVSGGGSQSIGASGSVTFPGLSTGSHTVTLSGTPSNCSVSGGSSQTVTVTAGGTASAAFTISCTALTGGVTVSTTTSGPDQPSAYTVGVSSGGSQTIGATGNVTFPGLATGSHTVTLSGAPSNCSVNGGTSQTVTVTAGGTATAAFTISCTALTGSLTVTTATSGPNQPSGYTVTVDGSQSRSLGLNTSTTYTGLTAANHAVQLNGIPANCSASEANPQTVPVPAGGTAQASFTLTCTAPNQPPSVTAGGEQTVLIGALFSLSGAGFSDPDHDGPWTVTIDWGDGTSDTRTASSEGSIGGSHSYPVTLLGHDYQLTVTVVDAHGGRASATKTVHVVLS